MIRSVWAVFFTLCLHTFLIAQVPSVPYQYLADPRYDVGNQDQILENLQAVFIQELFVNELFKTTELIEFEDDDDFYDITASNELMNSVFAREIAKMLAKQDLLNLNDYRFE